MTSEGYDTKQSYEEMKAYNLLPSIGRLVSNNRRGGENHRQNRFHFQVCDAVDFKAVLGFEDMCNLAFQVFINTLNEVEKICYLRFVRI